MTVLRTIASGPIAAPQYAKHVEEVQMKAKTEAASLEEASFQNPVHQRTNVSSEGSFQEASKAFVEEHPYIRTLSHQLGAFHLEISIANIGLRKATAVLPSDELGTLVKKSDQYRKEYFILLEGAYEAETFAQAFFEAVEHLNPKPITYVSFENPLRALRKVELSDGINSHKQLSSELEAVRRQRYQVANKLSKEVRDTIKAINKTFKLVVGEFGLYLQTVSYKGFPLTNQWLGTMQNTVTAYEIPVPKEFAITYTDTDSDSIPLVSYSSSSSSSTTKGSSTSSGKLERKRQEPPLKNNSSNSKKKDKSKDIEVEV